MTRNLKPLGLALAAVLAMSAFLASAAHATNPGHITAQARSYPLTLDATGSGADKFTAFGSEITCENSSYHSTISASSTSVTIAPSYSNCHVKIPFIPKFPVTVTLNSCDFRLFNFTTDTSSGSSTKTHASGEVTHFWNSKTQIECTNANDVIEVHIYANATDHTNNNPMCTLTIKPQTVASGPTADVTTKTTNDIQLTGTVSGLHVVEHANSSLCPEGTGTHTESGGIQHLASAGVTVTGTTKGGATEGVHIG